MINKRALKLASPRYLKLWSECPQIIHIHMSAFIESSSRGILKRARASASDSGNVMCHRPMARSTCRSDIWFGLMLMDRLKRRGRLQPAELTKRAWPCSSRTRELCIICSSKISFWSTHSSCLTTTLGSTPPQHQLDPTLSG